VNAVMAAGKTVVHGKEILLAKLAAANDVPHKPASLLVPKSVAAVMPG
jgi:hypothetical protein